MAMHSHAIPIVGLLIVLYVTFPRFWGLCGAISLVSHVIGYIQYKLDRFPTIIILTVLPNIWSITIM